MGEQGAVGRKDDVKITNFLGIRKLRNMRAVGICQSISCVTRVFACFGHLIVNLYAC
jgi:hypothetical protein